MDQHRDTLGTNGRQAARLDQQTDGAQLRTHLVELHKTISRLHALQVEYRELVESTRKNLQDGQALQGKGNTVILSDEQSSAD